MIGLMVAVVLLICGHRVVPDLRLVAVQMCRLLLVTGKSDLKMEDLCLVLVVFGCCCCWLFAIACKINCDVCCALDDVVVFSN